MPGGNAPRTKGLRAEQDLVAWLRLNGWANARRYLAGDGRQPGDVDGVPGVCLDVKHAERFALSSWLTQVEDEAPPGSLPFVVVRLPRERNPGRWALVTRVAQLGRLTGSRDWE